MVRAAYFLGLALLLAVLFLPACATSQQREEFLRAYHQQKLEDGSCR